MDEWRIKKSQDVVIFDFTGLAFTFSVLTEWLNKLAEEYGDRKIAFAFTENDKLVIIFKFFD